MKKPSFNKYKFYEMLSPVVGFVVAMIILLIIVVAIGENPIKAFGAIYDFTLSTGPRIATVFSIAIPLYLAGIAVAVAFKAGVFNIGAEGQYFFGGMVGAMAGIYLNLPAFLHIPVVVLSSMIGGALWAAIPALLKVRKGVHEVITTIMFNNIALALVNYLVNGPFSGQGSGSSLEPQTQTIQSTAQFGKLNGFFRGFGWDVPDYVYMDYSLIVAVIMGFVVWFLLFKMRAGFEIRAVGTSNDVSRYAGIRVKRVQLSAFLLSGGLAGLIGLQEIFAIRGFYTFEIASGLGFDGIAIALIGRNSPLGVVFAAILFAFLRQAGYGLQLFTSVPNSVIYVITGLMILIIVIANTVTTRYIRALRKKEAV
ncbi:MAG: ABC transporter permease [Spirochaetales bacterium]|nr:ABC transporter permease [Spirochaetales bacterium]